MGYCLLGLVWGSGGPEKGYIVPNLSIVIVMLVHVTLAISPSWALHLVQLNNQ